MPWRIVHLLWMGDRHEVREFYEREDLLSINWLYVLSEDDQRLLRALIIDRAPLQDDDDWDGALYTMTDVIMFRGYSVYPSCWYAEPAQPEQDEAAPPAAKPKKGKKK